MADDEPRTPQAPGTPKVAYALPARSGKKEISKTIAAGGASQHSFLVEEQVGHENHDITTVGCYCYASNRLQSNSVVIRGTRSVT